MGIREATTPRLAVSGFSLVELTIATAIVSLGVGGLSLLLLLAMQGTFESRLRTLGVMHSASLHEVVALLPGAAHLFEGAGGGHPGCRTGQYCLPPEMAGSLLESWQQRVERDFPAGSSVVCRDSSPDDGRASNPACDGAGGAVIKLFWQEPGDGPEPAHRRDVRRLPLP